jgi:hypothetical protein
VAVFLPAGSANPSSYSGVFDCTGTRPSRVLIADLEQVPCLAACNAVQGQHVAFGRDYISNRDLVERIRRDAPLNEPQPASWLHRKFASWKVRSRKPNAFSMF